MLDKTVILFQGDSITDGNRDRGDDPNHFLGHGYAYIIAGKLGSLYAEQQPVFYNRGISGNRVSDVYARMNEDVFSLKPNLCSFLVGVNDAGRMVNQDASGVTDRFYRVYQQLLEEMQNVLPETKLVICEPFILETAATRDRFAHWQEVIQQYQQQAQLLAKQYNAVFVPLQDAFDQAAKRTRAEDWLWDGVHPTAAGHHLLAERWLEVVTAQRWLEL